MEGTEETAQVTRTSRKAGSESLDAFRRRGAPLGGSKQEVEGDVVENQAAQVGGAGRGAKGIVEETQRVPVAEHSLWRP